MFRRCSAGSSYTPTRLEPPLELAWTAEVPGMVALSSPVVEDGSVYIGCRAERTVTTDAGVLACDAVTGAEQWFTYLPGGVALAPAVAGDNVLVTAMTDTLFALDTTNGGRAWTDANTSHYDISAPVFSGDRAWIRGEPKTLQMDWAAGTRDWESNYIGSTWFPYIYSAPAIGSDNIYYGFYGEGGTAQGGFSVVDRLTGIRSYHDSGAYRSPILAGDTLYVVGAGNRNDQRLTARDLSGNVLWTSTTSLGGGTGSPALAHGIVVVPGADGAIQGLSATDGASIWSHPVGSAVYDMVPGLRDASGTAATPAIADSVVYVGSLDGKLYALDLFDGSELWQWDFGVPVASSAALSGNMLFVGASDGHLYAFASRYDPTGVSIGGGTSDGAASVFSFYPPSPNPASTRSRFEWVLPARAPVSLQIFDVQGRLVRTLVDGERDAGEHVAHWDGRNRGGTEVAAGIYFARLSAPPHEAVRKLPYFTEGGEG
jgi:outer membrane protein assembly factor BamB